MSPALKSKSGFGLIELLLAMAASSILAVTIGALLYYTWLGWSHARESVAMQRDVSVALRVIAREVRASDPDDLAGGSSLTCSGAVFSQSGQNLVYGNLNLIDGWLSSFTADVDGSKVTVNLELNTRADNAEIEQAIFYSRN